jgi:alpha-amylase/alpha-mannosidase (GH57 family)
MQPVHLALFWHQHQPYYPDDVSGETLMPWVRLHATKDYWGMAMHLKEVPEFRCSINLVPSLLHQIQRYTEKGLSDRHLDVSRLPADGLSEPDAHYLLDQFFMANVDTMIRPYPRYFELYQKRGVGRDGADKALLRFNARELRDLQVWNNLTWIHPLAFDLDPELRELRNKGKNWTEAEKAWLLDKQMKLVKEVIPLHKELAASGQVELTTTPYYHPILPLLVDKRSARQAMPECQLPKHLDPYPGDARIHLERAVSYHRDLFGMKPLGMWPSEGSVSPEIIPLIAQVGIEWIATDEEILARSTNGWVSRDPQGYMRHPEMLYRPWRVEEHGHALQIIFRDHGLSDLIGFHYQRGEPHRCAADMLGKVEAIGRAVEGVNGGRPALVPIILDGENCWEYYPDGGVEFLRSLYKSAARHPLIRGVRVSDYLRSHPATDRIGKLFAGSWISHNFAIWIGHHEDNTAWDLLHATRLFLLQTQTQGHASAERLARAWEELYIAEGSDWFWWFGDDHSSAQDDLFDQLFRKHLQNIYYLLEAIPPAALHRPITRQIRRAIHTHPKGFSTVKVDGRRTYFEWINAGHYVAGSERGTMTLVTEGIIREVYFGYDASRLAIRMDTARAARDDLHTVGEIRIRFAEPRGFEIRVTDPALATVAAELYRDREPVPGAKVEVSTGSIFELTVPFDDLLLNPDDPIHFCVEVFSQGQSVDRAPREGTIETLVPGPDYELIMWQA